MTKMKSTKELIRFFGNPLVNKRKFETEFMMMWDVPPDIIEAIPVLPSRLFIHKLIEMPLEVTFRELIIKGLHKEIETFDGIYNPRYIRGSTTIPSRHSWGLAIDLNADKNKLGQVEPDFTPEFLGVWRDIGWTVGADWYNRPDPMHFQWDKFELV